MIVPIMGPIIANAGKATAGGYGVVRRSCAIALGHRIETATRVATITIAKLAAARRAPPIVHVAFVIDRSHKVVNA